MVSQLARWFESAKILKRTETNKKNDRNCGFLRKILHILEKNTIFAHFFAHARIAHASYCALWRDFFKWIINKKTYHYGRSFCKM